MLTLPKARQISFEFYPRLNLFYTSTACGACENITSASQLSHDRHETNIKKYGMSKWRQYIAMHCSHKDGKQENLYQFTTNAADSQVTRRISRRDTAQAVCTAPAPT